MRRGRAAMSAPGLSQCPRPHHAAGKQLHGSGCRLKGLLCGVVVEGVLQYLPPPSDPPRTTHAWHHDATAPPQPLRPLTSCAATKRHRMCSKSCTCWMWLAGNWGESIIAARISNHSCFVCSGDACAPPLESRPSSPPDMWPDRGVRLERWMRCCQRTAGEFIEHGTRFQPEQQRLSGAREGPVRWPVGRRSRKLCWWSGWHRCCCWAAVLIHSIAIVKANQPYLSQALSVLCVPATFHIQHFDRRGDYALPR